jgi:hypothetical protein
MARSERLPTFWKVAHAVLLLPPAAERVSESEHDDFGNGDALDEQEGAIGAEDPQRAFDLAPPVKRQCAGDDFDELKISVRSRREEGRVPPPGRDDNGESAYERSALECAAAGRSPNEYQVSVHDWSTIGRHVSACRGPRASWLERIWLTSRLWRMPCDHLIRFAVHDFRSLSRLCRSPRNPLGLDELARSHELPAIYTNYEEANTVIAPNIRS